MKIRRRKERRKLAAAIERGRALRSANREQEALEFLEQMVRRFPQDAEIRLLYALTLLTFRPQAVAGELAKAVELGRDDPLILVRAGHQLLSEGDAVTARSCAMHAKDLAPPDFILKSGLVSLEGRLAAIDGEDDLAEEKLRCAVAEDPDYSSFALALAKFLNERDRQSEAIAVIDNALENCKMKEGLKELREDILGTSPRDDEGHE